MASPLSPPPVSDTFPRTAEISASNPLGLPNFGAPPIEPLKITKARTRDETPGSVANVKAAFDAPSNVLKELLPYLAQRWGPEDTAGNNHLCGIYALTAALKNIMTFLGEQVPAWVDFAYLQNEMQCDTFKNSVRSSITHELSSGEPEKAPPGVNQEYWTAQRQFKLDAGVKMMMGEFNHKTFYGVEQLSRFLMHLNEKHHVHYRLGVVTTQKEPPTRAFIHEDPNSRPGLHYPVIWLHNYMHQHWESIGPNITANGRKDVVFWKLMVNVKTVVESGLYLVKSNIVGLEAQYELTASKNQWLYEVAPPEQLGSREGYVYVHTPNGPNADAWRVATAGNQSNQDTIRGQEGFAPVGALKATTRYVFLTGSISVWKTADVTKRAGAVHIAKRKRGPEEAATEGPNKRTSPKSATPRPTNVSNNPAPSTPKSIASRLATTKSINIMRNPASNASKSTTSRPATTMSKKDIIDPRELGLVRNTPPNNTYSEYFRRTPLRLFQAFVPWKAPWVTDFKEGYLTYSPDQILLAIDESFEEDRSRPCRVRDSKGREGWADPKFLRQIEMPFGIHRSLVYESKSTDDTVAYPEDQFPDWAVQALCVFHAQWTVGTRQDCLDRLRKEREERGVPLMLWTTKVAGGGFELGVKVRVEGDPTIDPDAQYVAYGLYGKVSKGVVWGNQLQRTRYTWGLRLRRHNCGEPTADALWLDNWYRSQKDLAHKYHAQSLAKFPQGVRPPGSVAPVGPPTFGFGDPGRDLGSVISPRLQAFVQSAPGSMAPPPTQSGGQRTFPRPAGEVLQQGGLPAAHLSEKSRMIVQGMMQPATPWKGPPPPAGVLSSFWQDHLRKRRVEDGDDWEERDDWQEGDAWQEGDD